MWQTQMEEEIPQDVADILFFDQPEAEAASDEDPEGIQELWNLLGQQQNETCAPDDLKCWEDLEQILDEIDFEERNVQGVRPSDVEPRVARVSVYIPRRRGL